MSSNIPPEYGKPICDALLYCARHFLKPSSISVLVAVASGCDSVPAISEFTGLSKPAVCQAAARLCGHGRWHSGRGIPGLERPLLNRGEHPHLERRGHRYWVSEAGLEFLEQLLGQAPAAEQAAA